MWKKLEKHVKCFTRPIIAMQKNTNLSDQLSLLVIDATEIISSASCFNDLILSRSIYIMIIIWRLFKMGRTRCLRSLRWTMGLGCVSVRGGTGQGWFLTPDSSTGGITHPARGGPATRCFGFCGQWSKFLPEGWRSSPNPRATLLFINSTTARDQPAARAVIWTHDLRGALRHVTKVLYTTGEVRPGLNEQTKLVLDVIIKSKRTLKWPSERCSWPHMIH